MDSENTVPQSPNVQKLVSCKSSEALKASAANKFTTPGKKQQVSSTAKSLAVAKTPAPKTPSASNRPKTAAVSTANKVLCKTPMSNSFSYSFDADNVPSTPSADAREAARIAKLNSTQKTITKVQLLKEKWAREKEQKLTFHKEKRELEKRKIHEESLTANELYRKAMEKQKELDIKAKTAEKQDILVRHESNILMKKDLEKEKQAKRRISVFLNNSIRKKQLARQKEIEDAKKRLESEDFTLKREDYLTQRQNKLMEEMARRQSLHHRLEVAKEQKEKEQELMNTLYHTADKELLDTRYFNWQDERNHEKQLKEEFLADLQDNNEIYKKQKALEKKMELQQEMENVNLLKTKELNWKDEQLYKEHLKQEEKEEMVFKSNQWKLTKEQLKQNELTTSLQKSYEFELTRQAHHDMKAYREKCQDDRRQSLSYRLAKARKDKDFEKGQQAAKAILLEEELKIHDLDRQDVQNYKQKIQESRRQSLEYRAQQEYQERMRLEGEKKAKALEEEANFHSKHEDWKDVQAFRETERAREREDLAWKLAQAHRQHEMALTQHQEQLSKMHLDLQCRREDWLAVQEYKKQEADKRRKSIQFRLDSWRKQKLVEENEKMKQLMMKEETIIFNEMDREELLAAKLTEEMMERHHLLTSEMKV